MIRYDFICEDGHGFDSWFRDSADYERLKDNGVLQCPECSSPNVEKALMTPGLPVKANSRKVPATRAEDPGVLTAGPEDPRAAAFRQAARSLRKHVEENSDYVGDKFADEARRIYYAESKTEERGIYGEATMEDAKALNDEGIGVLPLPKLPEDKN